MGEIQSEPKAGKHFNLHFNLHQIKLSTINMTNTYTICNFYLSCYIKNYISNCNLYMTSLWGRTSLMHQKRVKVKELSKRQIRQRNNIKRWARHAGGGDFAMKFENLTGTFCVSLYIYLSITLKITETITLNIELFLFIFSKGRYINHEEYGKKGSKISQLFFV